MSDSPSAAPATGRPVTPNTLIAAHLGELAARAATLGYTDAAFLNTLQRAAALADGLEHYVNACTTPQSAALASLAAHTQREDWQSRFASGETAVALEQEMLSGHAEGQLLKMLVHATRARRILEIGLFTGYSALAMAEALPDDGVLLALEIDPFAAQFAQAQFDSTPQRHKLQIQVGPARESLRTLPADTVPFDLIFIDADKGGYAGYLDAVISGGLLATHGMICVDNTLMQGLPYLHDDATANGDAIATFNRTLADDDRFEQVLIPIRDGLTLIRRA